MFDLIFNGGLSTHPKRGRLCKIEFYLETDSEYCIVMFEDLSHEICKITNLKELF